MEFLIFMAWYFGIGLFLTPFFTFLLFREKVNEYVSVSESYKRTQAQKCATKAFAHSLIWPMFLFVGVNSGIVLQLLKRDEAKANKQREADRIVEEYRKENSWETKFKKLDAETKQRKEEERRAEWRKKEKERRSNWTPQDYLDELEESDYPGYKGQVNMRD